MIALGHTADDFCESLLRNALFNGRLSALPPVTWSSKKDFRLIRPLVYVGEDLTAAFAAQLSGTVVPCGCSQKTGTVRSSLRSMFRELESHNPHIGETLLAAMGNLDPSRMLDTRYHDFSGQTSSKPAPEALVFPILQPEAEPQLTLSTGIGEN